MKISKIVVSVLCVAGLVFTTAAIAQNRMHWKGSGGWGTGSPYGRMYDPKTVETISGEIAGIESFRPVKGMGAGVHLLLKTDKETISVHLGPAWFIENQDLKLEEKERFGDRELPIRKNQRSLLQKSRREMKPCRSEMTPGSRFGVAGGGDSPA